MNFKPQVQALEQRENPNGFGPPFETPGPPTTTPPALTITVPATANSHALGTHGAVTIEAESAP